LARDLPSGFYRVRIEKGGDLTLSWGVSFRGEGKEAYPEAHPSEGGLDS